MTCLYGSQPSSVVFGCKTARITSHYGSQTSPVILCPQNSVISTWITSLYGSQPSPVLLCMQNSAFMTRLTSLYGSQTSSVVLSTHNSVLSTIVLRLYGSQPSSVAFGYKTATFGPEQQVSMCPRYHLSFCACKTACYAQELLVSMHRAKHRLLDQN